MPVLDLQVWADNLEDVRLPGIDAGILANTTEINARAQELTDDLAANVAATTTAQQTADVADALATNTFNQFVALEVALKAYADASAQSIRDDFQITIDGNNAIWQSNVETNVQGIIDAALPNLQTENSQTITTINTLKSEIQGIAGSYDVAVADLVNVQVPQLTANITAAQNDVDLVANEFTVFKGSYGYTTINEGLDDIRAENESNLLPLNFSTLRTPSTLWGKDIETGSGMIRNTLGVYGSFHTDDTDFSECFQFGDSSDTNIGTGYPVVFLPGRVYKISVRAKCVSNGASAGANAHVGVVTAQAGVTQFSGEMAFVPTKIAIADGVVEREIYVSSDVAAMTSYGLVSADYLELTGSTTATHIYAYANQNSGATTDGILRVASIEITDVTEVLAGVNRATVYLESQIATAQNIDDLEAEVTALTATLQNDYYTAVSTDSAIAGQVAALKTQIEDPNGTSLGSTLNTSYYTKSQTDSEITSTIAAYDLSLNSTFSALDGTVGGLSTDVGALQGDVTTIQNNYVTTATLTGSYRTEADTDTAISQQITNQTVTFDGQSVSLQTLASAVDGVRSEWGIDVNNNGVVSGIKLTSDLVDNTGVTSTFAVQADKFQILAPASTTRTAIYSPFSVSNGKIQMTADVAINGSLVVTGSVPKGALDPATQSDLDDGVQALSDAGTAQTTADAAQTAANNAQAAADSAPSTYRQPTAPTSPKQGDIWMDTTDNQVKRYSGASWLAASLVADGVVSSWIYAGDIVASQITAGQINADRIKLNGSFLEDDGTGNIRLATNAVGTTQLASTVVTDIQTSVTDSAQAITDAANAQGTANQAVNDAAAANANANSKNKTFTGSSTPTATATGDIWIDSTNDKVKRWNGSAWLSAQIKAESVEADWAYLGELTAGQVNAVAIDAASITVNELDANRIKLNGSFLQANVSGQVEIKPSAITNNEVAANAVDTAEIVDEAVTLGGAGTGTTKTGNNTWIADAAVTGNMVLSAAADVFIFWSVEQAYPSGSGPEWGVRLKQNTTVLTGSERDGMQAQADFPSGQYHVANLAAGTYNFKVEWKGSTSGITGKSSIKVFVRYK